MTTRTRLNLYFDPALMPQIETLALRRKVSKSAIVEAAVMSYLSGDAADQLEAAMSRRLDKLGRQIDALDLDLAALGETVSLFILFWLTFTPPLSGSAQSAARAKGAERFEGFIRPSASASPPETGFSRSCRATSTHPAKASQQMSRRLTAIRLEYSSPSYLPPFAADARLHLDTC